MHIKAANEDPDAADPKRMAQPVVIGASPSRSRRDSGVFSRHLFKVNFPAASAPGRVPYQLHGGTVVADPANPRAARQQRSSKSPSVLKPAANGMPSMDNADGVASPGNSRRRRAAAARSQTRCPRRSITIKPQACAEAH